MIHEKPFADIALDYLWPYFEHKQYRMLPGFQFRRYTSFGHVSIMVRAPEDGSPAELKFFLGLRHKLVEEAMAGLFGRADYYRTESHTLLIDHRHLTKTISPALPHRTALAPEQEVFEACEAFIQFMDRQGFDFLHKYRQLKAIDHLYNQQPEISATWCNHHYQRCFRGMVTASILRRNDLGILGMKHRNYLSQRGFGGAVVHKFDTTFARLGNLSLN